MRREEILEIFADATKEQINRLLDLNSADIGAAKRGSTQLQSDLDAANRTIDELRRANAEIPGMQEKIAGYEKADADRKAAEEQAAARAALEERFTAASGDRKYIHDRMREIVMDDFDKAIADAANTGKSDKEIFEALTKDKGYFASMNPPGDMGGVDDVAGGDTDKLSDAEYYATIFNKK